MDFKKIKKDQIENVDISQVNDLQAELDGKLDSVVAGTNITIDNTDPNNPVINASDGGGGSGSVTTLYEYNTYNNLPDSTREIASFRSGQTGTLSETNCYVDIAPTGSNATIDIKKNGTSVGVVTITANTTSGTQTTFSDTTIAKGDKFSFEATGGSTVAGGSGYSINMIIS